MQDKRKYKRFPLPVAHYQSRDDKKIRGVSDVWDVSREGFRIHSSSSIPKGAMLDFKINIPGAPEIHCRGEVCWTRVSEKGYWEGLRFTKINVTEKTLLLEYGYEAWLKAEEKKKLAQVA